MTKSLKSQSQLAEVVKILLGQVGKDISQKSVILALCGPLGVGKTALTKLLAQQIGIDPREITSPTFVLHMPHEVKYQAPILNKQINSKNQTPNSKLFLQHIDCWRMESFSELEEIGLQKMMQDKDLVVIEWADKFEKEIKSLGNEDIKIVWVEIKYGVGESERLIRVTTEKN